MWVGKDNPQVVAAAALNCVLLVDVERLARNGPSSSGVCELGGFHAFAARMLAPHPDAPATECALRTMHSSRGSPPRLEPATATSSRATASTPSFRTFNQATVHFGQDSALT